jgi:protein phosphatase 1 regulatory subunit 10
LAVIDIPADIDLRPRGEESQEKFVQEEREQTALGALYMSPMHIPDSPAEPSSIISEEETDKEVRAMTSGPEVDSVFWSAGPISTLPSSTSVADLVGQLAMGNVDQSIGIESQDVNMKASGLDLGGLTSVAAMQSLSAAASAIHAGADVCTTRSSQPTAPLWWRRSELEF